MKDKYYTPEIEELHIGLEYKVGHFELICTSVNTDTISGSTYKVSIKDRVNHTFSNRLATVKHLDREDIESVEINGEKFIHDFNLDGEEHPSLFNEHGYSKGYALDTQLKDDKLILLYHFPDGYVVIDLVYNCGSSPHSFSGIINNKSELKRILKQIGV